MIANSLIFPIEKPPRLIDIKRALLSYDKVYLPSYDDRELIPPNAFASASSPMGFFPLGINVGKVRPLGKVKNYDLTFERTMTAAKDAVNQESLVVLDTPKYEENLTIGAIPMPENTPNPHFVYQVYRQLSANPEFIMAVSRGLDQIGSLSENDLENIAPSGADDNQMQFYVNGKPALGLPTQALYNGFTNNEEERLLLTKLCLARLGAVVKNLSICQIRALHPYTSDPGIASVIQLLNNNTNKVYDRYKEQDSLLEQQNRLSRLHNIFISEFINPKKLEDLSIKEVLRLRTKAWGKSREARNELEKKLRIIAIENPDSEKFESSCRNEIKDYLKKQSDWLNEVDKFSVQILSGLGLLITVPSGSEFIIKLFSTPSLETTLLIGGAAFFTLMQKYVPELLDILKNKQDLEESAGFALFRPYSYIV